MSFDCPLIAIAMTSPSTTDPAPEKSLSPSSMVNGSTSMRSAAIAALKLEARRSGGNPARSSETSGAVRETSIAIGSPEVRGTVAVIRDSAVSSLAVASRSS